MKATILGSGDPLGMPVPMCKCKYCRKGPERLRAGLKVETEDSTVVFDIGPDLRQQLISTDTSDVDAFFATHAHFDHFGGLPELSNLDVFADAEISIYGSEEVQNYIEDVYSWIDIDYTVFEGSTEIGDLTVEAFPVEHSEFLPMQGYAVESWGKKVVYIPDLKSLPETDVYRDADVLFIDGMYLFEKHMEDDEDHAAKEELKAEIEKCNAEKVVLLGMSEHFNEMTVEEEKEKTRYEIGKDFKEYSL
ncbi:MBL fold metallo-hydrolase [Candidatus Nanohaloarchaea archaeon]|nr:MBL fold metallo-hydrolase [Candidatus Nanohaloarchaea archaeon]